MFMRSAGFLLIHSVKLLSALLIFSDAVHRFKLCKRGDSGRTVGTTGGITSAPYRFAFVLQAIKTHVSHSQTD